MASPAAYWRLRVQWYCIKHETFGIQNMSNLPAAQTSSTSTKAYRLCIPKKSQAPGTVTRAQREWRASRTLANFRVEKVGGCDD